jgi:hypothetical protein
MTSVAMKLGFQSKSVLAMSAVAVTALVLAAQTLAQPTIPAARTRFPRRTCTCSDARLWFGRSTPT